VLVAAGIVVNSFFAWPTQSLVGTGILLGAGNVAATLPRARARHVDWAAIAIALCFLVSTLGVGIVLPSSPGWSFRRDPPTPGGPYITALHQSQRASVRLFVHPKPEAVNLDAVIRRRRDQLAGLFHVRDLDLLVERVIREGRQPIHDYAAWQWQAVTQPVAVAGEAPSRVMFLSEAVERPDRIFEMLGLLRFPATPSSAQDDSTRALLEDLSFVMQSLQVR